MNTSHADIAVLSPDGQVQLIVEVKNIKGTTDDWAAKMRRNLVIHAVIPRSKFFLLALPDYFYLWRNNTSTDVVPADFKVRTTEILAPYVKSTPLKELGEESFELIISSWLNNLTNAKLTRAIAEPELQWLFDSGLYEAIKHGSVEVEAVV